MQYLAPGSICTGIHNDHISLFRDGILYEHKHGNIYVSDILSIGLHQRCNFPRVANCSRPVVSLRHVPTLAKFFACVFQGPEHS